MLREKPDTPTDKKRQSLYSMVHAMRMRVWGMEEYENGGEESAMKQHYGDAWTLLYGIVVGISKIENDKRSAEDEWVDEKSWQEHYDEWGYGVYGKGLRFGKHMAFFQERDFEIKEHREDEDEERNFDISG